MVFFIVTPSGYLCLQSWQLPHAFAAYCDIYSKIHHGHRI